MLGLVDLVPEVDGEFDPILGVKGISQTNFLAIFFAQTYFLPEIVLVVPAFAQELPALAVAA
jgi:hypothetical protein